MDDKLNRDDISEMLGLALMYKEANFVRTQIDIDHLIQILELAWEKKDEQHAD